MKALLLILTVLFSAASFAETSKCSKEDTDKIAQLSTKLFAILSNENLRVAKLVNQGAKEKWTFDKFKEAYATSGKEAYNSKIKPINDQLLTVLKAHPECDPEGLTKQLDQDKK